MPREKRRQILQNLSHKNIKKKLKFTRLDNLLGNLGIDYKGLDEEEHTMKKILAEEYKKRQVSLIIEVRKWRENHPEVKFSDVIRALYKKLEKEELGNPEGGNKKTSAEEDFLY